ncbi:MAG: virulence RhuM family protein [Phaeodactylibacter sp.]|nr:virulence RhuM family protein [Phaeodactylibacter sp.]
MNSEILIYQNPDGNIKIDVRIENETVWLTQAQMATLFGKDKRIVSEHIANLFKEGELDENSVVRKFRTTAADNKNYATNYYNLDVIISVGYRVKSIQGIQFRIWATSEQTAAELVYRRVDASLHLMGMLSYDKKQIVSIKKGEVCIR